MADHGTASGRPAAPCSEFPSRGLQQDPQNAASKPSILDTHSSSFMHRPNAILRNLKSNLSVDPQTGAESLASRPQKALKDIMRIQEGEIKLQTNLISQLSEKAHEGVDNDDLEIVTDAMRNRAVCRENCERLECIVGGIRPLLESSDPASPFLKKKTLQLLKMEIERTEVDGGVLGQHLTDAMRNIHQNVQARQSARDGSPLRQHGFSTEASTSVPGPGSPRPRSSSPRPRSSSPRRGGRSPTPSRSSPKQLDPSSLRRPD